jgi:hypothetical protein
MEFHHIYQFNVAKLRGEDVVFAGKFNEYPNLPDPLRVRPVFPLFRIDQPRAFKSAAEFYRKRLRKPLTFYELEGMIKEAKTNSVEDKMCRIRLALQTEIDREK